MTWLTLLLAAGSGAGVFGFVERVLKAVFDLSQDRRKQLAERRKAVLDATVALVTAKQNTGKDYYAGDVGSLFTRLMNLMENDGSAWEQAMFVSYA